jgi:hypothetical protein
MTDFRTAHLLAEFGIDAGYEADLIIPSNRPEVFERPPNIVQQELKQGQSSIAESLPINNQDDNDKDETGLTYHKYGLVIMDSKSDSFTLPILSDQISQRKQECTSITS